MVRLKDIRARVEIFILGPSSFFSSNRTRSAQPIQVLTCVPVFPPTRLVSCSLTLPSTYSTMDFVRGPCAFSTKTHEQIARENPGRRYCPNCNNHLWFEAILITSSPPRAPEPAPEVRQAVAGTSHSAAPPEGRVSLGHLSSNRTFLPSEKPKAARSLLEAQARLESMAKGGGLKPKASLTLASSLAGLNTAYQQANMARDKSIRGTEVESPEPGSVLIAFRVYVVEVWYQEIGGVKIPNWETIKLVHNFRHHSFPLHQSYRCLIDFLYELAKTHHVLERHVFDRFDVVAEVREKGRGRGITEVVNFNPWVPFSIEELVEKAGAASGKNNNHFTIFLIIKNEIRNPKEPVPKVVLPDDDSIDWVSDFAALATVSMSGY